MSNLAVKIYKIVRFSTLFQCNKVYNRFSDWTKWSMLKQDERQDKRNNIRMSVMKVRSETDWNSFLQLKVDEIKRFFQRSPSFGQMFAVNLLIVILSILPCSKPTASGRLCSEYWPALIYSVHWLSFSSAKVTFSHGIIRPNVMWLTKTARKEFRWKRATVW